MLRCVDCGGLAHAGLAHIHGDPTRPRCERCTKRATESKAGPKSLETEAEDLEVAIQRATAGLLQAA